MKTQNKKTSIKTKKRKSESEPLTLKAFADYNQKEKEKKLWIIIINSLKEHRILSPKELEKISKLDVF